MMTDKSISVFLVVQNQAEVLKKTLRVWALECVRYKYGAELVIVDVGSDDGTEEVVNEFLNVNADFPLRMVFVVTDETHSLAEYSYLAQSDYLLLAQGNTYPGRHVLDDFSYALEPDTIQAGTVKRIDSPFVYSIIYDDVRRNDPDFLFMEKSTKPWSRLTFNNTLMPRKWFEDSYFMVDDLDDYTRGAAKAAAFNSQGTIEFVCVNEAFLFSVGK